MDVIQQLGVAGILIYLFLKEMFTFLSKQKQFKGPERRVNMDDVQKQVQDLWDWHSKEDSDGVKIWYMRRSFEESMHKLADNIELQTQVLQRMMDKEDMNRDKLEDMDRKMNKILNRKAS